MSAKTKFHDRNRAVRRNFQRGRVTVGGSDDKFDADLASFIPYADENDGYKYLLAVIGFFSWNVWARRISKNPKEITRLLIKYYLKVESHIIFVMMQQMISIQKETQDHSWEK